MYVLFCDDLGKIRVLESVFGWSWCLIPKSTGSWNQIFSLTPQVQLDHFLHRTPKLGIPVEITIYFETFVEADFLLCTTISIDFNSLASARIRGFSEKNA